VHFYDNENGFADIGEYRNGEIIIGSEYVPEWMTGFRKYLRVKQYKG